LLGRELFRAPFNR